MKVLFVTNELFPFARGGIGRLIFNYITWNAAQPEPTEIHVVLLDVADEKPWASGTLCGAQFHDAEKIGALTEFQWRSIDTCESATLKTILRRSTVVSNAIETLFYQQGLAFDFIEFPDFMGLALATLRRRAEGCEALKRSWITIRLHSSMTLIQADEGAAHMPSEWFAAVTDCERYCLRHADLIVAHLATIAELNRVEFGFDDAWTRRIHIEFPPIILTDEEAAARQDANVAEVSDPLEPHTFLFSSRLQPFKRPDLFLRAAACFLRRNPDRQDRFEVISYGWDTTYNTWLESLIPGDLADQIEIRSNISASERMRLMATATIVVPSTFESLCIFAYESYLLGRRVILNGTCRAFGAAPFWQDGTNCLLFDGSVESLAVAMERSLSFNPQTEAALPETRPYWTCAVPTASARPNAPPTIDFIGSCVAPGQPETSFATQVLKAFPKARVIIIKDRLYDARPAYALPIPQLEVIECFGADIAPSTLRQAMVSSNADYVVFARPDAIPSVPWLTHARESLGRLQADLVAFTYASAVDRPRRAPLLDCPNLLAQNLAFTFGAVAVRRQAALDQLDRLGSDDDWLIGRLLFGLAMRDASAHVLDLPVFASQSGPVHRRALYHYTSDLVAQEGRRTQPHLAAYAAGKLQTSGTPYVDEWAVVDRSGGRSSQQEFDVPGSRALVARFDPPRVNANEWSATGWLEDRQSDGNGGPISLPIALRLDEHGLEIRFIHGAIGWEFDIGPSGVAERPIPTIASWQSGIACDNSPEARRLLYMIKRLSEVLPDYAFRMHSGCGLHRNVVIEDRIALEANRLCRLIDNTLVIHSLVGGDARGA